MAYERAFAAYDLRKFALAADACVAVAKSQTAYTLWMSRPMTRDRETVIRRLDIHLKSPCPELFIQA